MYVLRLVLNFKLVNEICSLINNLHACIYILLHKVPRWSVCNT